MEEKFCALITNDFAKDYQERKLEKEIMWPFDTDETKQINVASNPIDSAVAIAFMLLVLYIAYRAWRIIMETIYDIFFLITGVFKRSWKGFWTLVYDMIVLVFSTVLFVVFFNLVFSYMWTEISSITDLSSIEPFLENSSVITFMRNSRIFSWIFSIDYYGMIGLLFSWIHGYVDLSVLSDYTWLDYNRTYANDIVSQNSSYFDWLIKLKN